MLRLQSDVRPISPNLHNVSFLVINRVRSSAKETEPSMFLSLTISFYYFTVNVYLYFYCALIFHKMITNKGGYKTNLKGF